MPGAGAPPLPATPPSGPVAGPAPAADPRAAISPAPATPTTPATQGPATPATHGQPGQAHGAAPANPTGAARGPATPAGPAQAPAAQGPATPPTQGPATPPTHGQPGQAHGAAPANPAGAAQGPAVQPSTTPGGQTPATQVGAQSSAAPAAHPRGASPAGPQSSPQPHQHQHPTGAHGQHPQPAAHGQPGADSVPPAAPAAGAGAAPTAFGPPQVTSFTSTGHTPPGGNAPLGTGHTPPGGNAPLGGGTPPPGGQTPPRKRRKRTLIVISAAVATLLVAGAAVFALTRDKGKDDQAEKDHKPSHSATPSSSHSGSPTPTPSSSGSGSAVPADPQAKDIDEHYLGAWEGYVVDSEGKEQHDQLRRVVLTQGGVGSNVAEIISVSGDAYCQSSGKLDSADNLLVIESTVDVSVPDGNCSDGSKQSLRWQPDGTLSWAAGDSSAVLRPAKDGAEPVPAAYLGTWKASEVGGDSSSTVKVTISQGKIGTNRAAFVWDTRKAHCEGSSALASVESGLLFSPETVTKDETAEKSCTAGSVRSFTSAGQDKLTMEYTTDGYGDEPQKLTLTRVK
ncbi:hypothetical protein ACZ90_44445 [Streptomyces albus subsp. albus]|nr:hypothetical protein ACZ90_44445 [Streptomyces albus subsp. albus]